LELVEICNTMTHNGRILDESIAELRDWSRHYADLELMNRPVVRRTIKKIFQTGEISDAERSELYLNIEKLLPRELQQAFRGKRGAPEPADRARGLSLEAYDFVVSETHYEDRTTAIVRYATLGDDVLLMRDPENACSPNAIVLRLPAVSTSASFRNTRPNRSPSISTPATRTGRESDASFLAAFADPHRERRRLPARHLR
jgi:hypothetical protein